MVGSNAGTNRLLKEHREIIKNFEEKCKEKTKTLLLTTNTTTTTPSSSLSPSSPSSTTSSSSSSSSPSSSKSIQETEKDLPQYDYETLLETIDDLIILTPLTDNLREWIAVINGPIDTPFYPFRFRLRILVPNSYPHSPPTITFLTPVCHPNIHPKTGEICLDILKDAWTPIWTLESTVRAIGALLANGEASSPLNCDCGNLIRAGDWCGYWNLARMYCEEFAEKRKIPSKPVGVTSKVDKVAADDDTSTTRSTAISST